MHIIIGAVKDINIHALPHLLPVQRRISIGHHISLDLLFHGNRHIDKLLKLRLPLINIPHLQKHQGKAAHRIPFQLHRSILPVSVKFFPVNVFIRQIHAAVKGNFSVYHQDFPVISVIVMRGDKGRQCGECLAFDPLPFHQLRIVVGQQRDLAHPVIHHPHVYPRFGLVSENL